MPQWLAQIYVHIVFSTKNRTPWLRDLDLRTQLYAYMATILRDNVDLPALIINGIEDHLHALVRLSRRFAVMKVVQEAKDGNEQVAETPTSCWQGFRLAGRLRCVFRQCLVGGRREEVHSESTTASPPNVLSGRVSRALSPSWSGTGRTIRLGLGPSRWDSNCVRTESRMASQPRATPRLAPLALSAPRALIELSLRDGSVSRAVALGS